MVGSRSAFSREDTQIVPNPTPRVPVLVPALDTDRLTLRGHTSADFDECAAMWADPLVTRYIGGRPSTEEEVWARVLRYAGLWALLGFGYWVVRERATGRFVGEVGLADFRRELVPPLVGAPEVGWALASWAHGQGFATEAVRAAVAWSDEHLGGERTVCLIGPENVASVRVAEKCGYGQAARATYKGRETLVLERQPNPG
ncbi:MAG: GNAT family N-acetyltransferase [Gemmatimonadaceae bacterium]